MMRKKSPSIIHFILISASVMPAVGLIIASYIGCDKTAVIVTFTVFVGLMGTFYPGMKVNALDLSPNHAGTLMAIVNGIGSITGIITPYLVGVITKDVSK
jgi:MFS transporter, ACS family, solute carrier family 17 (sodium-dependent inorganic phosphate cotransporter), other